MIKFVGHNKTRQLLSSLIFNNRFPQSLLLHGPRSIGKFTLARALASLLLSSPTSPHSETFEESGFPFLPPTHPTERLVLANNHPDLIILSSDNNSKNETIDVSSTRSMLDLASLTPLISSSIVVLIDGAENMNDFSFNATLKTLEEPKDNLYFILCSHSPFKLASTIRSRCWMQAMHPLSDQEIKKILPPLETKLQELIISIARGITGFALSLAEIKDLEVIVNRISLIIEDPNVDTDIYSDIPDQTLLQIVQSVMHNMFTAKINSLSSENLKELHSALSRSYSLLSNTSPPNLMPFKPSIQQSLIIFGEAYAKFS